MRGSPEKIWLGSSVGNSLRSRSWSRRLFPALVGAGHIEYQRIVRAECLQGLGVQAGGRWVIGIVRRSGSRGRFGGGFRLRLCSGLGAARMPRRSSGSAGVSVWGSTAGSAACAFRSDKPELTSLVTSPLEQPAKAISIIAEYGGERSLYFFHSCPPFGHKVPIIALR